MELWIKGTAETTGDCLYHAVAEEEEEIRYVDITSLYPWVNKKAVVSGMVGARNLGQRVQRVLDRWTNRQWKDTGSSMAV